MRSVDLGGALLEHDLLLVGAVDVARAEGHLPAGGHAAARREEVIPAVELVDLGALEARMVRRINHDAAFAEDARPVGRHGTDVQFVPYARAGFGIGVHQIGLAVVVPERAGVDPAPGFLHEVRFAPLAGGILRRGQVNALVGHGEEDPEFAGVKPDRRRPHAAARLHLPIPRMRHIFDGVIDDRPVDQVARVEDWQPGRAVEAGGGQIEIVAVPDDIRIGIIGVQDGVAVSAVAGIGFPGKGERGGHSGK